MKTHYSLRAICKVGALLLLGVGASLTICYVWAEQPTSYAPVDIKEDFATTRQRMQAAKPEVEKRQQDLLAERYDLTDRPMKTATMAGGKPVQDGVRVKLQGNVSWQSLANMRPEEVR